MAHKMQRKLARMRIAPIDPVASRQRRDPYFARACNEETAPDRIEARAAIYRLEDDVQHLEAALATTRRRLEQHRGYLALLQTPEAEAADDRL